jgi:CotH kinase protein/Secretion system C-terminal sorting domain
MHNFRTQTHPLSICVFFCFLSTITYSQSIPYRNLFEENKLPNIYVSLPADSLKWLYNNTNNDRDIRANFIFDDGVKRDTMLNVGFRLRGNTSRSSAKKSFKVKFNAFKSGIKYQGVKELNLNGSHNDPTMVREKLFYDTWNMSGLPPRRATFAKLYINNIYYGLYTNIEELDDEWAQRVFGTDDGNLYKCTYPADLKSLGTGQTPYKNVLHQAGVRAYDLKTNELTDDYSDLAKLCTVINTATDFECQIQKVINVQGFLKAYAVEILSGNWDDYAFNKNNYFLYHNPKNDLFEFITYDTDNSFGVDFGGGPFTTRNIYTWHSPTNGILVAKLLAVPTFKNQFSFYINQLTDNVFSKLSGRLDSMKTLINAAASSDTYRTLDYGFTYDNFRLGFESMATNPAKFGIKQFIAARNQATLSQLTPLNLPPIMTENDISPRLPKASEQMTFRVKIDNLNGSIIPTFYYSIDSVNYLNTPLTWVNNSFYEAKIQLNASANALFYRFEVSNTEGSAKLPACGNFKLRLNESQFKNKLFINEFMADNTKTIKDETGIFEDWVELYNGTNAAIYLGDKYLTDDFLTPNKWKMPTDSLAARSWRLFWLDNDVLQGIKHANFKLSAAGEKLGIFSTFTEGYAPIDTVSFGQQTPDVSVGRLPDGVGSFRILPTQTPNATNGTVGVADVFMDNLNLDIYPNPIDNQLSIQFKNNKYQFIRVDAFDASGKYIENILSDNRAEGEQIIRWKTTGRPTGIYFLRFDFGGRRLLKKVVLAR